MIDKKEKKLEENIDKDDIIQEIGDEDISDDIDNLDDDNDDLDDDNDEKNDNDDLDDDNDDNDDLDDDTVYFQFNTTKHKLDGKHRLKRDTIFRGKLNEETEENMYTSNSEYYNDTPSIEKGTIFDSESKNFEELEHQRKLKKEIYDLLDENTELDFSSNRRKPNKQSFNGYYEMLLDKLYNRYTKSEIFVELSYYFTDHIFNMYKLLYPKHATSIIMELKDKGYLNELDDMEFV